MRIARTSRPLSGREITEALMVFRASLPAWPKIRITDGLGPLPFMDRPYTEELSSLGIFFVNLGPDIYPDATAKQRYKNLLIHELTHVWQYDRGQWVVLRSAYANTAGEGYNYTIEDDDTWDGYNVEQQAKLVQDWYDPAIGRQSTSDVRFPFIEKIIRHDPWDEFKDVPLGSLRAK
jgi:hypothetical protein